VRVGESLDWSAPQLFGALELSRDALIEDGIGTYKREVHGFTSQGDRLVGGPPRWLKRWPMLFETTTLHVDRERFDQLLFNAALDAGVEFVWDRVRTVHMAGDRISDCVTSSGRCHRARWYIDASGRSRIVGRTARIATQRWGCERIGLWRHRLSGVTFDGTALHFDDAAPGLVWAWEIPIDVERTSVGVVMPVTDFRDTRGEAESLDEVMDHVLARFSSLDASGLAGPTKARTFQPYVSQRVAGTNWLMVGEAAALVDPLSSSGVSAAMRHGVEAAATIVSAEESPESRDRLLARYDRRVSDVARLYNEALERLLYHPRLRTRLGMRQAARSYVILGYLTSALYNRIEPAESMARQATMTFTIHLFRQWIRLWSFTSLTVKPSRPLPHMWAARC
jgi:flavin-dependent dehydrogenase